MRLSDETIRPVACSSTMVKSPLPKVGCGRVSRSLVQAPRRSSGLSGPSSLWIIELKAPSLSASAGVDRRRTSPSPRSLMKGCDLVSIFIVLFVERSAKQLVDLSQHLFRRLELNATHAQRAAGLHVLQHVVHEDSFFGGRAKLFQRILEDLGCGLG